MGKGGGGRRKEGRPGRGNPPPPPQNIFGLTPLSVDVGEQWLTWSHDSASARRRTPARRDLLAGTAVTAGAITS